MMEAKMVEKRVEHIQSSANEIEKWIREEMGHIAKEASSDRASIECIEGYVANVHRYKTMLTELQGAIKVCNEILNW